MITTNRRGCKRTENSKTEALGALTTQFGKFTKEVEMQIHFEYAQETALLGTARMLRLVLGPYVSSSRFKGQRPVSSLAAGCCPNSQ